MSAVEAISALDQRGRERAYELTRTRIAGPEPQQEDFARKVYSRYTPEHTQRMKRLGYVLLVPAFTGSAIRIFLAAFETNAVYLTGTQHPTLSLSMVIAILVGLMSVLLAETGQVAFTLWASSVPDGAWWMRRALNFGAFACLAFALAANVYIVKPGDQWQNIGASALAWIETLLPPLLVLIAANVLKQLALDDNENRHAAQRDYEAQHAAWLERKAQAHLDARWMQYLANELRDALRNFNRRSYAKLRALSDADWRWLVQRELAADNWYALSVMSVQPMQADAHADDAQPVDEPLPPPRVKSVRVVGTSNSNGKHTGEFAQAVQANADDTFTGVCPHCGWSSVKNSQRGAMAALIAHKRSCKGLIEQPVSEAVVAAEDVILGVNDGKAE